MAALRIAIADLPPLTSEENAAIEKYWSEFFRGSDKMIQSYEKNYRVNGLLNAGGMTAKNLFTGRTAGSSFLANRLFLGEDHAIALEALGYRLTHGEDGYKLVRP